MILSGQAKFEDGRELVALNPKLLVEVLSPSMKTCERSPEAREYWKCSSVQQDFLIRQDSMSLRQTDGKTTIDWITDREEFCPFESLDRSIPMTDIYERVNYSPRARISFSMFVVE